MKDNIFKKLLVIMGIGGACFLASLLVLGLVAERQGTSFEAKQDITSAWGDRQTIVGPMLVQSARSEDEEDTFILPETLRYETVLEPEIRSRGIFKSVVYTSHVKVSGEFSAAAVARMGSPTLFSVMITDTRGIEQQFDLMWNGRAYPFKPGAGNSFEGNSGLHASVPVNLAASVIPFSFELDLKGSEGVSVAPLGDETELTVSSAWPTPKFVGSFLPAEREISDAGFSSVWKISSFGRSYPQTWERGEVGMEQLIGSAAGVDLYQQVNAYDMVFRSVKYAMLFIVITFGAFFLFDVLASVRVHPIQYFLVGSALALFYLLLLSLSEQIGFLPAYALATTMIALLVTGYSASVLKSRRRALPIFGMLAALYGYLYFILQLEDYALLFGSLLVFAFLAVVMYMTRNVDWFALGGRQ